MSVDVHECIEAFNYYNNIDPSSIIVFRCVIIHSLLLLFSCVTLYNDFTLYHFVLPSAVTSPTPAVTASPGGRSFDYVHRSSTLT